MQARSANSSKLSPSPVKENVNRYHQEKIRERSRDNSYEKQLISPPSINSKTATAREQPTHYNYSGNNSQEGAKNHTERNIVEEYRQKLRSKLNESANAQFTQHSVSSNSNLPKHHSHGGFKSVLGSQSNVSTPHDKLQQPLRLSPPKIKTNSVADLSHRMHQKSDQNQLRYDYPISENSFPHQKVSDIRYIEQMNSQSIHERQSQNQINDPNHQVYGGLENNPLQQNSFNNHLQGSSNGPLKNSDNSSMQSVFNRIQNLRQSLLNHEGVGTNSQPIISQQQKPISKTYEDYRDSPSPPSHNGLGIYSQNQQTNMKVELSPMMYSIGDSNAGTVTKNRRASNDGSTMEVQRRQSSVETNLEMKLRSEMETKLQFRLSEIEANTKKSSDAKYQDLLDKFNTLLSQFNQLKTQGNSCACVQQNKNQSDKFENKTFAERFELQQFQSRNGLNNQSSQQLKHNLPLGNSHQASTISEQKQADRQTRYHSGNQEGSKVRSRSNTQNHIEQQPALQLEPRRSSHNQVIYNADVRAPSIKKNSSKQSKTNKSNQDIDCTFTESDVQKIDSRTNQQVTHHSINKSSPSQHPSRIGAQLSSFEESNRIDKNKRIVLHTSRNSALAPAQNKSKSVSSMHRDHSSKSLVPLRSRNDLLSMELLSQVPQMPKPVQEYNGNDSQKLDGTKKTSLHKSRFMYSGTEKIDVKKIDYESLDKVGYFAHKQKMIKEESDKIKKNMPADKKIIAELQRQVKNLNSTNTKLNDQLEFMKKRLLTEGGNACCCQELKSLTQHKNQQMLNIIEIWKRKASEQGIYWQRQVQDLREQNNKNEMDAKHALKKMEQHQSHLFTLIINKQQQLELDYAQKLKATEKDNKSLQKRVVQHRHALVQLKLNDL